MSMEPKDTLLLSVTHDSPRSACSKAGLKEHPLASRDMWLASVNAGATEQGYWEWAEDTLSSAWADLQLKLPPIHTRKAVKSRPVPLTAEEFARQLKEGEF